jgi:hypothetical protein
MCHWDEKTYETVTYNLMLQQHGRGHLGMLLIVVFDEIVVTDPLLLLHQYCDLDDLSETGSARIPGFEDHGGLTTGDVVLIDAWGGIPPHIRPHNAQALASEFSGG